VFRESTKGSNQPPEKSWLYLLQSCYQQLKDYQAMAEVMEILVEHYPTEQHMTALAAVYSQIDLPKKHLALLESLWESQWLSSQAQIRNLIALQLQAGAPYKAATTLQQSLESGKLENSLSNQLQVVQAWISAKEQGRAVAALESSLPEFERQRGQYKEQQLDDYNQLCFLLGQLYFERQQWRDAVGRLQSCVKHSTKERAQSNLLIGIALVNQDQFDAALPHLQQAQKSKRFGQSATQWLRYSQLEQHRLAQLAK
jgi:hypothetical protein